MKVLVTGAAGFVGSHTVDLLVEQGYEVIGLDSLDPQVHGKNQKIPVHLTGHIEKKAITFHLGDVRDRTILEKLVGQVDAVMHLAAAVGVGQSMYMPHHYADVNMGGTALLMDVLANNKNHKVKKIVVASSMSIYGEGAYRTSKGKIITPRERTSEQLLARKWEHLDEDTGQPLEPLATPESKELLSTSIYAITKKVQEEMLLVFGRAYKIPVVALRYFNIYGPRQSLNNPYTGVAAIFLSRLLNGNAPLVFEDGLQSRDFIYVRDIARANVLSLKADVDDQRVYNVGTGRPTTILDVGKTLAKRLGLTIEPKINDQYRAGDIRHCYGDTAKIEKELGFKAEVSKEKGFDDLIAWCKQQKPTDTFDASLSELTSRSLVV